MEFERERIEIINGRPSSFLGLPLLLWSECTAQPYSFIKSTNIDEAPILGTGFVGI